MEYSLKRGPQMERMGLSEAAAGTLVSLRLTASAAKRTRRDCWECDEACRKPEITGVDRGTCAVKLVLFGTL